MICRNASDNYVHAKCESKAEIDGTRKCLSATNESRKPRKVWNLHSQEKLDLCMSFVTPKRGSLPVMKCRYILCDCRTV